MDASNRDKEPIRGSSTLTVRDLQEQARQLKDAERFDVSLEQRLAYLMPEVGALAEEVLKLSGVKEADSAQVRERLGMEIYDVVWNLFDLADLAGANLEEAFARKIDLNQ